MEDKYLVECCHITFTEEPAGFMATRKEFAAAKENFGVLDGEYSFFLIVNRERVNDFNSDELHLFDVADENPTNL